MLKLQEIGKFPGNQIIFYIQIILGPLSYRYNSDSINFKV